MSKGQHVFSQVPRADIPRSSFKRSHGYKTTFDAGLLIPFYVDEALPGDTFRVKASMFARLATPIVPIMDNMYMDTFFFAVPNRLLWENWQKFCGEQDNPGDSTDFLIPQISSELLTGFQAESMADYMGIPTESGWDERVSALPFRAYNLIWNEWFRDENLQNKALVPVDDATYSENIYPLRRRGKRHDYFTSCLPWPQKGPGVDIPLGGFAPVISDSGFTYPGTIPSIGDGVPHFATALNLTQDMRLFAEGGVPENVKTSPGVAGGADIMRFRTGAFQTGLVADLSDATAATINELRESFQIQKMYERDARGGTRYVELLKSHFGVTSPDSRLQRPEYLGGSSVPVIINPVAQTSGTSPEDGYTPTPQGNLSAYGIVHGGGNGFSKSFVEHSTIIGLVMVRADLSYQQGLNRMWTRQTRFDYYWPALSHLGEQAVLAREIYSGANNRERVFGYQERWAEYRYAPSLITGRFRSNYAQTLDFWHLAIDFSQEPTLSDGFIQENPPVDRVIAIQDEPHFLLDCHFAINCARPMPLYSVPGLIDHF